MVRATLVAAVVFVAVGFTTARVVLSHTANGGAYQPMVHLGADLGGLFAGGAAATLVFLALALRRRS